jgi:putative tricarboxylic transport membrane protein
VRQSLLIFGGDPSGFVTRPISGGIIALIVLVAVLFPVGKLLLARRRLALVGGSAPIGHDEKERS